MIFLVIPLMIVSTFILFKAMNEILDNLHSDIFFPGTESTELPPILIIHSLNRSNLVSLAIISSRSCVLTKSESRVKF